MLHKEIFKLSNTNILPLMHDANISFPLGGRVGLRWRKKSDPPPSHLHPSIQRLDSGIAFFYYLFIYFIFVYKFKKKVEKRDGILGWR
jgi:hypothetical protein